MVYVYHWIFGSLVFGWILDFKRREPHKHVGRLPKCMDAFLLETNNVCMYKITVPYIIICICLAPSYPNQDVMFGSI